jgi:hypothetical protein
VGAVKSGAATRLDPVFAQNRHKIAANSSGRERTAGREIEGAAVPMTVFRNAPFAGGDAKQGRALCAGWSIN